MKNEISGIIIRGLGGLYDVLCGNEIISCRARGVFRHEKTSAQAGDRVVITYDGENKNAGYVIDKILPRKNLLIRPALANTDVLFIAFAPSHPGPDLLGTDKLTAIAVHNGITPVIVITKADIDRKKAEEYRRIYEKCGFTVLLTSSAEGEGMGAVRDYICTRGEDEIFAFAGASGVGKSTLIGSIFSELKLETGRISEKTARGRHTTRAVTLFSCDCGGERMFIADTPGFSMLDFINFNFFGLDELVYTFPEFEKYLGDCRYRGCTHTKEEGCAVLAAVAEGAVPKSRHDSYLAIYEELKKVPEWKRKAIESGR